MIYRVHQNVGANQTIFLISVGLAIRNEVVAFALLKVRMEKDKLKQGLHESINFWVHEIKSCQNKNKTVATQGHIG
jgi:hypothetical protein